MSGGKEKLVQLRPEEGRTVIIGVGVAMVLLFVSGVALGLRLDRVEPPRDEPTDTVASQVADPGGRP